MSVVAGENPDVLAAMEGGSTFDQRLAELRRAAQINQQAVTDLRLGREALAVLEDARKVREEADAIKAAAESDAKRILDEARIAARSDRDSAAARVREASQVKNDVEAYVSRVRDEVDAYARSTKEEAALVARTADAARRDADRVATEANAKAREAEAAKADADATKARYERLIEKIRAVIAEG